MSTKGVTSAPDVYWQGGETLKISRQMHADNRKRLVRNMGVEEGLVLVQGGTHNHRADTDHEILFRQESNFHFLFGVAMEDCYGTIDLKTGESTLLVPFLDDSYRVWFGTIPSNEELRAKYCVDKVIYTKDIAQHVKSIDPQVLYVYGGVNSDSGMSGKAAFFEGMCAYRQDTGLLRTSLEETRVVKSPQEIEIIRYANRISSAAHKEVMRQCKPGMMEYQLEAIFCHHAYMHGGMRLLAYSAICGSGPNSAVLHYGHGGAPNDRLMQEGELVLNDMGGEYYCYASDITCSYPVSGVFTDTQKQVYEAVLEAKDIVNSLIKPGVSWVAMHEKVEEVLAKHLIGMGLLKGDLKEVIECGLPAVFMPHGLGHNLGLETHDVGGYPRGSVRATRSGLKSLRNVRPLKEGMVLTNEPGCYFIESEITNALNNPAMAKHMDGERLLRLVAEGFGGVRLEDNLLVTKDGCEIFTDVPRTVADIENIVGSAHK